MNNGEVAKRRKLGDGGEMREETSLPSLLEATFSNPRAPSLPSHIPNQQTEVHLDHHGKSLPTKQHTTPALKDFTEAARLTARNDVYDSVEASSFRGKLQDKIGAISGASSGIG